MSVVAWDGHVLAADSATWTSAGATLLHRQSEKIHAAGEGYVAGVGNRIDVTRFAAWAAGGFRVDQKFTFARDDSAMFYIDAKNRCWHFDQHLTKDTQPWPAKVSMGSGGELAWGAMHAGASAIEAVRIAIKFNEGCAGRIRYVNTRGGEWGWTR